MCGIAFRGMGEGFCELTCRIPAAGRALLPVCILGIRQSALLPYRREGAEKHVGKEAILDFYFCPEYLDGVFRGIHE